ncbi:stress-response A/B barrel domain-containing protein UP3 isoform X1 [Carica papaya]|uniref:stress-response A/B barrel domain-containing protein UP3 isoform X1 n=2 Tax=Carica papaya TaxID=3649 RepID=UPI000B8CA162|nr:stress-response A/B barrel domain-containing protein UP3 isoform X1 [Carica papaya]
MMLSLKARPLFSSSFFLAFSPPKRLSQLNLPFLTRSPSRSSPSTLSVSMSSTTPAQTIEHVVLFNVKQGTDPAKLNAMLSGLSALTSLDTVLHLTASPILCNRSSAFSFTHILHSRYASKDDLSAYAAHPNHLAVVKESVLPICEDVMAVDWVADHVPIPVGISPGSPVRITFLKLKENVTDEAKEQIFGVVKGIKHNFPGISQITCGENFSPGRAKGFSIASIAAFKDLGAMEAVESNEELVNLQKEKVRDHLESVIVVDFIVPSSSQSSSLVCCDVLCDFVIAV